MSNSKDGVPRRVEIPPPSNFSYASSRRNFIAVTATVGAIVAGNVLAMSKAQAAPGNSFSRGRNPGGNFSACPPTSNAPHCNCFLQGTQILTPNGETAIEDLKIGNLVTTVSGEEKPIKWIARMRFGQGWGSDVAPIKVARGALTDDVPCRDLYVTEAHCLYINGLLIPAIDLVNGQSISKCTSYDAKTLEYLHIELQSHDAVIANGAPAETLAGGINRQNFDNFEEYVQLYGAELVTLMPFAPIAGNFGGRQELKSRLRSLFAPIYDRRRPLDIIRDEIADRADRQQAA